MAERFPGILGQVRYGSRLGALLLLAMLFAAPLSSAQSLSISEVGERFSGLADDTFFPREVQVSGKNGTIRLKALGSGTRKQLMFKVYESAPYAQVGASLSPDPARAMYEGSFAKLMILRFLRDTDSAKVRDAINKGFERALSDSELKEMKSERDQLMSFFSGGIKAGQSIELAYIPGEGLHSRMSGRANPVIRGDAFANAVMKIWFGSRPVDEGLKRDMLRLAKEF